MTSTRRQFLGGLLTLTVVPAVNFPGLFDSLIKSRFQVVLTLDPSLDSEWHDPQFAEPVFADFANQLIDLVREYRPEDGALLIRASTAWCTQALEGTLEEFQQVLPYLLSYVDNSKDCWDHEEQRLRDSSWRLETAREAGEYFEFILASNC